MSTPYSYQRECLKIQPDVNVVESSEGLGESCFVLLHVFLSWLEMNGQNLENSSCRRVPTTQFRAVHLRVDQTHRWSPTGPKLIAITQGMWCRSVKLVAIASMNGMSSSFVYHMHPAPIPIYVYSKTHRCVPWLAKGRGQIWSCLDTSSLGTRINPRMISSSRLHFRFVAKFWRSGFLPQNIWLRRRLTINAQNMLAAW